MHIVSLALGGCLKAEPVRYGITEDTGGHIAYILGEMKALAQRGDVSMAEIITRRFDEPRLGCIHASSEEWVAPKLVIRRIDSGNRRYLSKEALSADRSEFTEALIAELAGRERLPDLIHAHFADAADVARRVEDALGIPFIYTAHSLGMDKRATMDTPDAALEARIAEEDRAIAGARAIVGSSRDECERQLMAYPSARVGKIHRIIPGIEQGTTPVSTAPAMDLIAPFLRDPAKPMILAIARPVHKKNLARLVDAFGTSASLREKCNLVILAGLRDGLQAGEPEQREVLNDVFDAIDRHDLYGSVAYPKSHSRAQLHALYSLCTHSRGVFVNAALMEPYGLTLVEAAAHGLPVVATKVGGPQDIVAELEHGLLVDPDNDVEIAAAIERLIDEPTLWESCSRNALANSGKVSWEAYAASISALAQAILARRPKVCAKPSFLFVSDLDNTLTGCDRGVDRLRHLLMRQRDTGFVIATGRSIVEARRLVRDWALPTPSAWITSVGTEIFFDDGIEAVPDEEFARSIAEGWQPERIERALAGIPGLIPQPVYEQRAFKRSYFTDGSDRTGEVTQALKRNGINARVVFSHERLLDVLPPNAGKAAAMHHVAGQFGVPFDRLFAAGDSGNDIDMLSACQNAILVANHSIEVAALSRRPNVYCSTRSHASGAVEGLLAQRRARQRLDREKLQVSV